MGTLEEKISPKKGRQKALIQVITLGWQKSPLSLALLPSSWALVPYSLWKQSRKDWPLLQILLFLYASCYSITALIHLWRHFCVEVSQQFGTIFMRHRLGLHRKVLKQISTIGCTIPIWLYYPQIWIGMLKLGSTVQIK